jgi:hypothetical protein
MNDKNADDQPEQKRSKRHRMHRNKISTKDRIAAVRQFAEYAQEVNRKHKLESQKFNGKRSYFQGAVKPHG